MKMVKSHTRKKSDNLDLPVKQAINAVADQIKQWTVNELGTLQHQGIAVCVPTKNGYKIGLYTLIVFPNHSCEVWNFNQQLIHTFTNKVSAVLYTIYTIKKEYYTADDILRLDTEINKHYVDIITMRRCIDSARKRQDYVSVDIRTARLNVAEKKFKLAQEKVATIHRRAKAHKVWE